MTSRRIGARTPSAPVDPNAVRPATRPETLPVGLAAVALGFIALSISATHGYMLLYGDAVAHLGIARRILDTNTPGLANLGGVWLPLPHLLMLPFIGKMEWWQDGMAGAWPSLICYVLGAMGMFRLARRIVPPGWAIVATAFFGLNANLLYLSTTAMTEPLFLALLVWIVLLTLEFVDAAKSGEQALSQGARLRASSRQAKAVQGGADRVSSASVRMVLLGVLILAATMTRYDGWVLGASVWFVAAWALWKRPTLRSPLLPAFVIMTLLSVAGPAFWFWYNHVFGHDWLDFMRGPYSAKEIDRKTSPPGSHKYWGWHNPAWSLMLYARTAQVDAAAWETGWLVAAAALWGSWRSLRERVDARAMLLWLPLPFYVYSVSYGSVPIFIPQLYPHSFYNSRYGTELLPALAIFPAYALWKLTAMGAKWLAERSAATASDSKELAVPARREPAHALAVQLAVPLVLLLIVVNTIVMLHAVPLVLKEALTNSRGRLAIEEPLTAQLEMFPRNAVILMENSDRVGSLQKAGIPLKQTIGPGDYYGWRHGLEAPAQTANYVVAVAGSDLAKAVEAHPEGLTELSILCASGQPCLRVYQSDRFRAK